MSRLKTKRLLYTFKTKAIRELSNMCSFEQLFYRIKSLGAHGILHSFFFFLLFFRLFKGYLNVIC